MKASKFGKFSTEAIVNSDGLFAGENGSDKPNGYPDTKNTTTGNYDMMGPSLVDTYDTKDYADKPQGS